MSTSLLTSIYVGKTSNNYTHKKMKKIALTLLLCIGVCHSTQPVPEFDDKWELYKINFQKAYNNSTKELERRLTWEDNLKYIQEHNSAADNGTYSYWLEVNHLSDLTIDEVVEQGTGVRIPTNTSSGATFTPQNTGNIPETVDWRTKGYVTPVKNQGSCGSCWAFSATGALEGQNKAVNDILLSLSEQDLVDCSNSNFGCDGGWPAHAFLDIRKAGGINTESKYPYHAKKGACRFSQNNIGANVSGYNSTRSGDENDLKLALAFIGPVSVCVRVTRNFQSYRGGVLNDPNCNGPINHAVLVVGYGVYKGQDYWLVKNSWGTGWGMNGYILMSRNKNNQCSIATYGVFPKVQPLETKSSNHGQALEVSFQKLLVLSGVVYLRIVHFYL